MSLIRFIFWTAIFVLSTFAFTVLFEHGPMKFGENSKKEYEALHKMFGKEIKRQNDQSDKLTPPIK